MTHAISDAYLQSRGVLPHEFNADKTAFLLDDALSRSVPFIYFSCGTMPHWEAAIYARNLPPDQWNARWWKYVSDFQGIEPPEPRGEQFCDAATKTHINDTPAYYYNYAFATVFKFQLHDYIARKILHQLPQSCNYADNKEAGAWLNNILKKGGTEDWRKVLKDATGEDISTRAMMDYFKPLMTWLEDQNKGPPDRLGIAQASWLWDRRASRLPKRSVSCDFVAAAALMPKQVTPKPNAEVRAASRAWRND